MDLGIHKNIEIASFASLPAKTGLGSSSSFSVALTKALHTFLGKRLDAYEAAKYAARLEIELLGEPIGSQDQFAASFGGFNVLQFNPDDSVEVKPVLLDYKRRLALEDGLSVFFIGIARAASSVLTEQKSNIDEKFETLKEMADSVPEFEVRLLSGDFKGLGDMLHEGWIRKKSLASNVSSGVIDKLYDAGMNSGAWGGKVIGAGGGGCVMFLSSPDKKSAIKVAVEMVGKENNLEDFQEIPVKFVQAGAEVLYNADYVNKTMLS